MRNPFKPKTPMVTTSMVDPGAIFPYREPREPENPLMVTPYSDAYEKRRRIEGSYDTDHKRITGKKVERKS